MVSERQGLGVVHAARAMTYTRGLRGNRLVRHPPAPLSSGLALCFLMVWNGLDTQKEKAREEPSPMYVHCGRGLEC